MTEHEIQCKFVRLIDRLNSTQDAGILYCATQGGVRVSIGTARKMVAAGYRKGIPDIMIYTPQNGKVGLALELKTKTGRPSDHQIEWIQNLRSAGWDAHVVKGYDACVDALFEYFKELKRPKVV
jgi:hypothetical protein